MILFLLFPVVALDKNVFILDEGTCDHGLIETGDWFRSIIQGKLFAHIMLVKLFSCVVDERDEKLSIVLVGNSKDLAI
jgi:hypothetical protein